MEAKFFVLRILIVLEGHKLVLFVSKIIQRRKRLRQYPEKTNSEQQRTILV